MHLTYIYMYRAELIDLHKRSSSRVLGRTSWQFRHTFQSLLLMPRSYRHRVQLVMLHCFALQQRPLVMNVSEVTVCTR
jgi:hypothetical protein